MKIVVTLGKILGALLLLIGIVYFGARLGDGPLGMIPGGPIASGDWAEAQVADWTFATDIDTIEFQLEQDSISRTVWIAVAHGRAFIPASLKFPPGKDWYHRAQDDGSSVLRIDGKRYAVDITRVDDGLTKQLVGKTIQGKYETPPGSDENSVMFFEVKSRAR